MKNQFLTLNAGVIERALIDLIGLNIPPGETAQVNAQAIVSIFSLLYDTPGHASVDANGLVVSHDELQDWRRIAFERLELWVDSNDVNASMRVLTLRKQLQTIATHGDDQFAALHAIADSLEAAQKDWKLAWAGMDGADALDSTKLLKLTCKALNAKIEARIGEIAQLTGNNEDTLRSGLGPKSDLEVWFSNDEPVQFLRNVSVYRSFNVVFWDVESRMIARDALYRRFKPAQEPVSVDVAVQVIQHGGVPTIQAAEALLEKSRDYELSPLEAELKTQTLLTQYDANFKGRVSSTAHFAFATVSASGEIRFNFWPAGLARSHVETEVVDLASPEVTASPVEQPKC